jgi:hypothetical protein
MKSKKAVFVLGFGLLLFLGWIFCIKKASGIDEINQQNELVKQAQTYIDKELYVRGIPLLEEAAEIKTDNLLNVQKELLSAYLNYGDMKSYYALVQAMDRNGQASAADYLQYAKYNLEIGDVKTALTVSMEGLSHHEDEELKQFYEDYRYGYTIRQTEYQQILPSRDGTYMPAFDGTKWNYIDEDGRIQLTVDADFATGFNNDGKAVIKTKQRFCVILQNGDLYGIDETGVEEVLGITDNYVIAKKDGVYGFYNFDFELLSEKYLFEAMTLNNCGVTVGEKNGKWGIITDSGEEVTGYIYEDVAVNSLGEAFAGNRAMVKKDGKWILIDTEGEQISENTYAAAKAPESEEYIAVGDEDGKWGFINADGKQVIDFTYRDAESFRCGLGAVKLVNEWGYISSENVLAIEDSYISAEPFHEGYAVVGGTEGMSVLELSFYDLED